MRRPHCWAAARAIPSPRCSPRCSCELPLESCNALHPSPHLSSSRGCIHTLHSYPAHRFRWGGAATRACALCTWSSSPQPPSRAATTSSQTRNLPVPPLARVSVRASLLARWLPARPPSTLIPLSNHPVLQLRSPLRRRHRRSSSSARHGRACPTSGALSAS